MTESAAGPSAGTVLVVEDDALIAMLLEQVLDEAGFRPAWSHDGVDVLTGSLMESGNVVAAVVNLGLADGLDGRGVIRRLRARRPGIPIAVVTGYSGWAPQADLRGLGGPTARFGKPIPRAALRAWLTAAAASSLAPTTRMRRRRVESLVDRRRNGP